jgi:hypothetical protein
MWQLPCMHGMPLAMNQPAFKDKGLTAPTSACQAPCNRVCPPQCTGIKYCIRISTPIHAAYRFAWGLWFTIPPSKSRERKASAVSLPAPLLNQLKLAAADFKHTFASPPRLASSASLASHSLPARRCSSAHATPWTPKQACLPTHCWL